MSLSCECYQPLLDLIQGVPVSYICPVLHTRSIADPLFAAWSGVGFVNTLYHQRSILTSLQGSVPFLLREHLSYSQLAFFSLASYPYSLKLFWSPIVDSKFLPSIGRRKSWIIPMQLIIGTIMFGMSFHAEKLIQNVRF